MHDSDEKIAQGKLDLVPMIDCVMLLLLFFIMTTRFTPEEKQISALLPPHGQAQEIERETITPPQTIHVLVLPDLPAQKHEAALTNKHGKNLNLTAQYSASEELNHYASMAVYWLMQIRLRSAPYSMRSTTISPPL
jgi:biopolymer transport protein ExbD